MRHGTVHVLLEVPLVIALRAEERFRGYDPGDNATSETRLRTRLPCLGGCRLRVVTVEDGGAVLRAAG